MPGAVNGTVTPGLRNVAATTQRSWAGPTGDRVIQVRLQGPQEHIAKIPKPLQYTAALRPE